MIAEGESVPSLFNDKRGDPVRSDTRCRNSKNDVGVGDRRVCDEYLIPVKQVIVSLVDCRGFRTAGVRARVRFGKTEGAELFALRKRRQVFLLLFVGTEGCDRIASQRNMRRKDNACAAVYAGQLFDCDGIALHIQTGAAVFLRIRDSHQSELTHLLNGFHRKFVFLIEGKRMGLDFCFYKFTYFLTQGFLFLCGLIIHHCSSFVFTSAVVRIGTLFRYF